MTLTAHGMVLIRAVTKYQKLSLDSQSQIWFMPNADSLWGISHTLSHCRTEIRPESPWGSTVFNKTASCDLQVWTDLLSCHWFRYNIFWCIYYLYLFARFITSHRHKNHGYIVQAWGKLWSLTFKWFGQNGFIIWDSNGCTPTETMVT